MSGAGKHALSGAGEHALSGAGKHALSGAGEHALSGAGKHAMSGAGEHALSGAGKHAMSGAGEHAMSGAGKHAISGAGGAGHPRHNTTEIFVAAASKAGGCIPSRGRAGYRNERKLPAFFFGNAGPSVREPADPVTNAAHKDREHTKHAETA